MSEDDVPVGCAYALALFCAVVVGIVVWHEVHGVMRDEAVKHGAAEYYLDQNHARQWRWKDEEPK